MIPSMHVLCPYEQIFFWHAALYDFVWKQFVVWYEILLKLFAYKLFVHLFIYSFIVYYFDSVIYLLFLYQLIG